MTDAPSPRCFSGTEDTDLRLLVDIVWQHATESKAVPFTKTADMLIARYRQCFPDVAQARPYPDPQTQEACAALVEDFPDSILHLVERPGGPPGNYLRAATRKDLAAAIRSMQAVSSTQPLTAADDGPKPICAFCGAEVRGPCLTPEVAAGCELPSTPRGGEA